MTPRQITCAAALLALAGCSKSPVPPVREGAPDDAVRLELPEGEALPGTPDEKSQAAWAGSGDGMSARYGRPGEPPLVSVACRSGVLVVTRHAPAEVGAQALFALVGANGILRLPVDATSVPGVRGYIWQGTLAPDHPAAKVLEGAYTGTLPAAGRISVSGGNAPRDVVGRCRAHPTTAAPTPEAPAAAD